MGSTKTPFETENESLIADFKIDNSSKTSTNPNGHGYKFHASQNKNLESIIELQQNAMAISAVSYMGKQVSATGQENMLGEGQSTFSYTLPQNAAAASATITNEAGSTVYYGAAETTSGKHSFVWDGSSTTGVAQPNGKYQLTINATNPDGQPITPSYGITGSVTGVEFDGGTAVLSIGSVKVPLTNVTQIHDTE